MQRNETGLMHEKRASVGTPARLHGSGELTVYGRANCRLGGAGMEPVAFSMNNWRHSSINVREARPRDLEAIARLENESFESDRVSRRSLREFLRAPHRPVIAATIDDELAGYALVSLRKGARALRIYSIAVDGRFTRRGVGRALLQACEAYARRHRRDTLTLEVRYDNASAIALYESCGFRQFGEHTHYYADGATALRYEKALLPIPQETGNNSPPERVRPLRNASRPR